MGIGVSILVFALGAILAFAVTTEVNGIDLQTVGWILMVVGGVGLLVTLVVWGLPRSGARRTVVEERDVDVYP